MAQICHHVCTAILILGLCPADPPAAGVKMSRQIINAGPPFDFESTTEWVQYDLNLKKNRNEVNRL